MMDSVLFSNNFLFICMPCEVLMIVWIIARSQTIWTLPFEFNLDQVPSLMILWFNVDLDTIIKYDGKPV